eukprot:Skav225681  [mRNA]  locus=scaffold243:9677:10099:- [translate_table: standard]
MPADQKDAQRGWLRSSAQPLSLGLSTPTGSGPRVRSFQWIAQCTLAAAHSSARPGPSQPCPQLPWGRGPRSYGIEETCVDFELDVWSLVIWAEMTS